VGPDPVAIDVVSRELMAFSARTRYLTWAIEDGVGIGDLARIDVLGESIAALRHPFMTSADELRVFFPQLTLHDCDACSGCRIAAQSALNRFRYQKLLEPIDVIYGGQGDKPATTGKTFVVGNCAERFADLGTHIAGCPASQDEIIRAFEDAGIICQECRTRALAALEGLSPEFLSSLRVVAAGAEVYSGDRVERSKWHLELLVGDCMKRYAFVVHERAVQFGLEPDRDVIWLRGCPSEPEAIADALCRLQARLAEKAPTT